MNALLEKRSKAEDEYFARQQLELRKKWARERAEEMASGQAEQLKALHFMKCPKCGMDLHTIELHHVRVDQCASCLGIWLDRGEIEQMLQPEREGLFERIMSVFR